MGNRTPLGNSVYFQDSPPSQVVVLSILVAEGAVQLQVVLSVLAAEGAAQLQVQPPFLVAGGTAHHPLQDSRNRTGNPMAESPLAHVGIEPAALRARSMELQPPEPLGRPNQSPFSIFSCRSTIPCGN
ncbi:hypothetical protein mRhiFer1_008418 [Rhinolophus ferrumequinum]|uniref:Uncharacterized protein n=1 Tax=Rhinolophus ferrumequinum TaxID=59479 RepID=A0A7J7V8C4_RHIFE|nr:hypothetical protein mRhiFer1_008418 [Rhinolophus ferrumequinum]